MTSTSRRAQFDDRAFGRRLRLARIALDVTEQEAATAVGRTAKTWRKYERTGEGYCTMPLVRFVQRYRVSPEWLLTGDGHDLKPHLTHQARGKLAILPICGAEGRRRVN